MFIELSSLKFIQMVGRKKKKKKRTKKTEENLIYGTGLYHKFQRIAARYTSVWTKTMKRHRGYRYCS